MTTVTASIRERAAAARAASRRLANLSTAAKDAALLRIAELLETEQGPILDANARDLEAGRAAGLDDYFLERLALSSQRLNAIAADTRAVSRLPDPVGEVFDARTLPNGLQIARRRVPLGVVACIYESRPNVTIDIAALALKSGNASVLRGGKEARHSNAALGEIIRKALDGSEVPADAVQVVSDPDRVHVDELLKAHDLIDVMVPRGGAQLIEYVRQNATMPVVAHGEAVVQIYVDQFADLDLAANVVDNAKTRRYSICNAVDTLLLHAAIAPAFLDRMAALWGSKVTFIADDRAYALLAPTPGVAIERATDETWRTEHLALRAGVRIVDSLDQAMEHIQTYGSHHSDAILTENYSNAMRFVDEVDSAAVYVNASTQFTDGAQFGLGAEVGISTQKMHARGPMGLRELTSYKWTIFGRGQVRPL
jgi:glutamate-5-semialdehyde dehydrogenase